MDSEMLKAVKTATFPASHRVYVVYDAKGDAHKNLLMLERNDQTAIRSILLALRNDANLRAFAGDYTLFCVGVWDEVTGWPDRLETKENLGTLLQLMAAYEKEPVNG